MADPSSFKSNVKLAKRIEAYWAERGAKVSCSVVSEGFGKMYGPFAGYAAGLRSNMRNGLPVKWDKPEHVYSYVLSQMETVMTKTVIRRFETDEYLKAFYPDTRAPGTTFPTGYAEWTSDLRKAKVFDNARDAIEFFQTQSTVTPFRPDGKPNRPLTIFSVSFETLLDTLDKTDALRNA